VNSAAQQRNARNGSNPSTQTSTPSSTLKVRFASTSPPPYHLTFALLSLPIATPTDLPPLTYLPLLTALSTDAVAANLSTLSLDAQKRAEKDAKKKEAKATAAEARRAEELATSRITIKRVERNKRKHVTEVSGLEAFNIDIKKLAKELGKKFATGSSAGKLPGGVGEVITVQGDLSEDIEEWICDKYEQVKEDNIELVEDKKKKNKAEPPMVAPQ
jgi:density-regulated protein DRP1